MRRLFSSVLLSVALWAADPPKPATKAAPVITSEMREAYFQARAELFELKDRIAAAEKRLNETVAKMQKVCRLTLDQQSRPQCEDKSEPVSAITPKPKAVN